MGIYEGRGQLGGAVKDLMTHWRQIRMSWRDARAEEFERTYLLTLEHAARSAASAMDEMAALAQQIRRDCE